MSEVFDELPTNRNDKENNRFGLASDGRVGVRVIGGTKSEDGTDINDTILEQMRIMNAQLADICDALDKSLNHLRYITDLEECRGDKY